MMFKTLKSTYALELMGGILVELDASHGFGGNCHIPVGPVRIVFPSGTPMGSTDKRAIKVREGSDW